MRLFVMEAEKHRKMKKVLFFLMASALLFSCSEKDRKGFLLPGVTGNSFEAMVVTTEPVWNSESGSVLKDVLAGNMEGLPQPEPYFKLSYCPRSQFDDIMKPMRNIVLVDVDPQMYTQARIKYERERWARSQALISITSPDKAGVTKIVSDNKDRIRRFFSDAEAERMLEVHEKSVNSEGSQKVKDMFGVNLLVPASLDKSKVGENFIWFSNVKYDDIQNIVVYKFPYKDTSDLSMESLVRRRDSVMKINVPGAAPDSYVATEKSDKYGRAPVSYVLNVDGRYTVEIRGFWYMENMVMAGPFVSRACLSADHKDVIVTECFLFAPNKNKRNILRSLESALSSLEVKADTAVAKPDSLR